LCTVFVIICHVEVVLHGGLEQGVVASRHNVWLPYLAHACVDWHLEMNHNVVHNLREGGNVDAVAAETLLEQGSEVNI
jgi:hypothetical protein